MTDYKVPILDVHEWQRPINDKDLVTAPTGPSKGDRYIIAGTGGDWSGGTINDIAYCSNASGPVWSYISPTEGMITWVKDENEFYKYNGSSWSLSVEIDNFTLVRENNIIKLNDRIENNIMLLAFKMAVQNSLTYFNMVDGITDEYEDESGIDTGSSTNEDYDSTDDLYSPTSGGTNIKLLLHCNGSDESTSFPDTSSSSHTVTANGTAQVDTAVKKWGTGALLLDGDSDYLSIADSSDWDICGSNSDDWTIDFWVKHTDHAGDETYLIQREDGSNQWKIGHVHGSGLKFFLLSTSFLVDTGYGGEITDTDWHHIALCKVADEYAIYKDGTQVNYVQDSDTDTYSGEITIGGNGAAGAYLDGHMDDIRITHENIFSASPVVGLSDTITIPTSEHSDPSANNMTLISDTFTAESQPDNVRIVIFEEDVDVATINTDLTAEVSIDGGSNYATVTLSDEGDYASGKRILSGIADVSGQSGTSIIYRIKSLNNKDLKIHATSCSWG